MSAKRQMPKPRAEDAGLVMADFRAMVELFGSFGTSRGAEYPGLLLCDSGTEAALENYALLLPGLVPGSADAIRDLVRRGLDFFAECGRSHVWPLFPGLPGAVELELDYAGVNEFEDFYGMVAATSAMDSFVTSGDAEACVVEFVNESDAEAWADATWWGFDSEEDAPDSFVDFTRNAISSDKLSLIGVAASLYAGAPEVVAATGMLCTARDIAGIYYVATHPKYRRRGLAMLVMKELLRRAGKLGYEKICLLATPDGRPLYHRCGFYDTGIVRLRIMENAGV